MIGNLGAMQGALKCFINNHENGITRMTGLSRKTFEFELVIISINNYN